MSLRASPPFSKWAYNNHTARGVGMPGAPALEREVEVVLQASEW